MFEGFPDGGDYYEPWNYENGEPPSDPPPKWWENLLGALGLITLLLLIFRLFFYGI